jgi:hypothetical protein
MDVSGGSGSLTARRTGRVFTAKWLAAAGVSILVGAALFRASLYQDHWVLTPGTADDGSPTVMFSLDADAAVAGWLRKSTPRLWVSCVGRGGINIFVHTGLPAAVEPGPDRSVRLQVDADEPALGKWAQSENRQSLFAPPGTASALGRRLSQARRFRFAFVPFHADVAVATFSVYGFDAHWRALVKGCEAG